MSKAKRNGFAIVLLACGLVMAAGCAKTDTAKPGTGSGVTGAKDDGPATNPEIKTTAEAMAKEVIADEKAAEAKYKDKVVEVEGKVQYANKTLGNDRMISLAGAKKMPTDVVALNISCIPAVANLDKAWELGRGQKVKVVGKVVGISAGFLGVTLDRCSIAEVDKNPTAKITAEALTGEFAKDPDAAKKKFTESEYVMKELIVEGNVAGTETSKDGNFHSINLAGKDGYTVSCTVKKDVMDGVKKGDKVTMKGDLGSFDKDKKRLTLNTAFVLKKG